MNEIEKQKEREEIRTRLQYSLAGNYTDSEWDVIINNILAYTKDVLASRAEMIRGMEKKLYRNATNSKNKEIFDRSYGFNEGIEVAAKVVLSGVTEQKQ